MVYAQSSRLKANIKYIETSPFSSPKRGGKRKKILNIEYRI